jgi:hypothetical protein
VPEMACGFKSRSSHHLTGPAPNRLGTTINFFRIERAILTACGFCHGQERSVDFLPTIVVTQQLVSRR